MELSRKLFGLWLKFCGFFLLASKASQLRSQNGCLSTGSFLSRFTRSASPKASIGSRIVVVLISSPNLLPKASSGGAVLWIAGKPIGCLPAYGERWAEQQITIIATQSTVIFMMLIVHRRKFNKNKNHEILTANLWKSMSWAHVG